MPKTKEYKCEDIGFEHCWEDITEHIVYATNPPSYPPKKRKCRNCGKTQTLELIQAEIKEWRTDAKNH